MGNFKDNPKNPFEVRVPNKIRKRIAMHEKHKPESIVKKAKTLLGLPAKSEQPKKRGSLWSRFTGRIKKWMNSS